MTSVGVFARVSQSIGLLLSMSALSACFVPAGKAVPQLGPAPHALTQELIEQLQSCNETQCPLVARLAAARGGNFLIHLRDLVIHRDPKVRFYVLYALSEMGEPAQAAAPQMIAALSDPESRVQGMAALALGKSGYKDASAFYGTLALLKAENPKTRQWAAEGLGAWGPAALDAVPALRRNLKDKDLHAQIAVIYALGRISRDAEVVAELIPLLAERSSLHDVVINALVNMGEVAVPALIQAMDQPELRSGAVQAIEGIGSGAIAALPIFIRQMHAVSGQNAVQRLGVTVSHFGPQAIPAVLDVLKTGKTAARVCATHALRFMHEKAAPAVPVLLAVLSDRDSDVAANAAYALSWIGGEAYAESVKLLKSSNPQVRALAASTVADLSTPESPVSDETLGDLADLLSDDNVLARQEAARALLLLQIRSTLPFKALLHATKDPDSRVSSRAFAAFEKARVVDAETAQVLIDRFKIQDGPTRAEILRALHGVGRGLPAAVELMARALSDADRTSAVAQAATEGLVLSAEAGVAALVRGLQSSDVQVRLHALNGLAGIQVKNASAQAELRTLFTAKKERAEDEAIAIALAYGNLAGEAVLSEALAALQSPQSLTRVMGAAALGAARRTEVASLQALIKALKDPSLEVRFAAEAALRKFRLAEEQVIAALAGMVSNAKEDEGLRIDAAYALGEIGEPAQETLLKLWRTVEPKVAEFVERQLRSFVEREES